VVTTTATAAVTFATTAMTASSAVVSALDAGLMFAAGGVVRVANMALAVARFVAVEVVEGLIAMLRHWTNIAVAWVVPIVDVAIVAVAAVIPGTGSDEYAAAAEPVRAIVAVWSARVRGVVEVSVRAYRGYADVN
jgi:hypothetical protein